MAAGYDELSGSPKESLSESSGSTSERRFLVPWNTRLAFAAAIGKGDHPWLKHCRVVGIDLQPWTDDLVPDGVITDPSLASASYGTKPCLVTIKYGPDFSQKTWPTDMPKPTMRAGTELRYQIRGSGKFLLVPCSATRWEDDPTIPVPVDANAAVLIPQAAIMLQWDLVDNPPLSRLSGLLGKVNSTTFLGNPPETVLFEDFSLSETFRDSATNTMHTNRVNLNYSVRAIPDGMGGTVGWNHDYREFPAGWARMLLSDGQPRYKLADMSGMFT